MKFPLDMYLGDIFNRATVKNEEQFNKFKALGYTWKGAPKPVKFAAEIKKPIEAIKEIKVPSKKPQKKQPKKA